MKNLNHESNPTVSMDSVGDLVERIMNYESGIKNIVITLILIFGVFITFGSVPTATAEELTSSTDQSASSIDVLQPAAIVYNENLRVNGIGYFPKGVHIGQQGTGGVTYFNGTIINNTTTKSGAPISVTFGDNVRIDGYLHGGPSLGYGDNVALKIGDNMYPGVDAKNDFGKPTHRFRDAYFSRNVTVGDLIGNDIIHTSEIATTNDPQSNQLLSYNGEALEWVTVGTSSSDDGDGDGDAGDIIVGDITSVTAGTGLSGGGTSGGVTLNVADSGITSAMISDGTITGSDLISTYNTGEAYDARFLNDDIDETMTGALTVNNILTVNSSSAGTGVIRGTNSSTTGYGVYGYASAATGTSYGGYFVTDSSSGFSHGVHGHAGLGYAVSGEVTNTAGLSGYFAGGDFMVELGTNSDFVIDIDGGGVGIDVTSPQQTLDVVNGGLIGLPVNSGVPAACNAANEGAIFYDSADSTVKFCAPGPGWRTISTL